MHIKFDQSLCKRTVYVKYIIYIADITMAAISMLNPKAEIARASQALAVNMSGAKVNID